MRGGLTQHDLVGEAAVGERMVQFVKTHFPERLGHPVYAASRAVLLVRNPYDAIESYFNLMLTSTHTNSIKEEVRAKHVKLWEEMALKEINVWKAFHEYWLEQDIPLLVIRYEDLIRHTDEVVRRVIRFVLEINHMGFFDQRIDRCIREEQIERLGSYKPRSGGIGKSLCKYSPKLLQEMNIGLYSMMEKFGYGEMLAGNDHKEWQLEPLDDFAVEIESEKDDSAIPPLRINAGKLVRGPDNSTDWRVVRKELGISSTAKCECYKCSRLR
jgi:hypothetical protein